MILPDARIVRRPLVPTIEAGNVDQGRVPKCTLTSVQEGFRRLSTEVAAVADVNGVTAETLGRLLAAFNAHDLDAVMGFFADDCVLEMPRGSQPWGRRLEGRAQVRDGLASRFAGIPDVHYSDDRHFVAGDRGCSEWLLTGTTAGGDRVEIRGCDLFEFRLGKVVRKDSYWKIVER